MPGFPWVRGEGLMGIRTKVRFWSRQESGATAVEFALVGFPFIFLLIGIIELSVMFAAMSTLDSATNTAARLVRTGQAQMSADPETTFRESLCEQASVFLDCSRIVYEVITMNSFSDFASFPPSYDEEGNMESNGFDAGSVDDVVLIRVSYAYPLMTPLLGAAFADGANNTKRMMTTVVLETEPYDVNLVVDEL